MQQQAKSKQQQQTLILYGSEERLLRDIIEALAVEYCWSCPAKTSAYRLTDIINFLSENTSFDKTTLKSWYDEILTTVNSVILL